MVDFETRFTEIIERTPSVKSFRLETGKAEAFKAGQFFQLTINVQGKDVSKYFSFSNSPTEKGYLEFTKRMTGSDFSNALNAVKPTFSSGNAPVTSVSIIAPIPRQTSISTPSNRSTAVIIRLTNAKESNCPSFHQKVYG